MNPKQYLLHFSLFIFLLGSSPNIVSQPAGWTIAAPGVWKRVIGIPDKLDLLNTADIKPAIGALTKMGDAEFPVSGNEIVTNVTNGKTYLQIPPGKR